MASLHPIVVLIQEYRQIAKLKGTYLDPLENQISKKDGRVMVLSTSTSRRLEDSVHLIRIYKTFQYVQSSAGKYAQFL
jgi:hypothetical protein